MKGKDPSQNHYPVTVLTPERQEELFIQLKENRKKLDILGYIPYINGNEIILSRTKNIKKCASIEEQLQNSTSQFFIPTKSDGLNYHLAIQEGVHAYNPSSIALHFLNPKGEESRQELFTTGFGLAINYATKRMGRSFAESDDLVQDFMITLNRSIFEFDYTKGFQFSTYLIRALSNHTSKQIRNIANSREVIWSKLSSHNTNEKDLLEGSVEAPQDPSQYRFEEKELLKYLSALSETERKVIEGRFFLEKDLRELGKELNLCKERVRQIESKSIEKMRELFRKKGIIDKN